MPNVSSFGAQTDNAVVSGTVTDRQMIIPDVPPQGLMSVGPRVTPNFVKPREWNAQTTYHFFDAVRDTAGNAYVATKPVVPAGTPLTNEDYWFLWADPDTRFDDLNETVKTFNQRITENTNDIATKAPINHASEETVYGIGNSLNYGHLKLATDDTPMMSDANAGIAATPKYVADIYVSKNKSISMLALGFGEDATANDELIKALANTHTMLNVDGDFPFTKPLTIDHTLILSGRGTLIYKGASTNEFFINIDESESADELIKLRMQRIELHINCKNNINGIKNKCGAYNIFEFFVEEPKEIGVEYVSGNGYDNLSTIFVNAKNQNVTGIYINKSDERFASITTHNCMTGVKINGSSIYINVLSGWCYDSTYFNSSVQLHVVNSQSIEIDNLNCDTFQTALKFDNLEDCHIGYMKIITNTYNITPGTDLWNIKTTIPNAFLQIDHLIADKYNYRYRVQENDIYVKVTESNLELVEGDISKMIRGVMGFYYETGKNVTNIPTSMFVDKTSIIVDKKTKDMIVMTPSSRWNTSNYILISERTSIDTLRWGKMTLTY